jgi:hypothetical protein
MALTLAPLGAVLLVAGILAGSRPGIGWALVVLLVGLLALALLGVAWGLRRSAALAETALAEQRLDVVLTAATGGAGCAPAGPGGDLCGSTGLACGSGSAPGGCGASCLARQGIVSRSP